jgi:hypothetical protein
MRAHAGEGPAGPEEQPESHVEEERVVQTSPSNTKVLSQILDFVRAARAHLADGGKVDVEEMLRGGFTHLVRDSPAASSLGLLIEGAKEAKKAAVEMGAVLRTAVEQWQYEEETVVDHPVACHRRLRTCRVGLRASMSRWQSVVTTAKFAPLLRAWQENTTHAETKQKPGCMAAIFGKIKKTLKKSLKMVISNRFTLFRCSSCCCATINYYDRDDSE